MDDWPHVHYAVQPATLSLPHLIDKYVFEEGKFSSKKYNTFRICSDCLGTVKFAPMHVEEGLGPTIDT